VGTSFLDHFRCDIDPANNRMRLRRAQAGEKPKRPERERE
jgi:hypothetical protein